MNRTPYYGPTVLELIQSDDECSSGGESDCPIAALEKQYSPKEVIGQGVYGKVHRSSNPRWVIKYITPQNADEDRTKHALAKSAEREIHYFRLLNAKGVPHIPFLQETAQKANAVYAMVLQKAGLNLFSYFHWPKMFTLKKLVPIAKKHLEALAGMHRENLAHCDLKLDNCTREFILDLGLASVVGEKIHSNIASRYRPPEIYLRSSHTTKADIWSLGIILFKLYTRTNFANIQDDQEHPIKSKLQALHIHTKRLGLEQIPWPMANKSYYQKELLHRLPDGNFVLKDVEPFDLPSLEDAVNTVSINGESVELKTQFTDLLKKMLQFDPEERISAQTALDHPFFASEISFRLKIIQPTQNLNLSFADKKIRLTNLLPNNCIHLPQKEDGYQITFWQGENRVKQLDNFKIQNNSILEVDSTNLSVSAYDPGRVTPPTPEKVKKCLKRSRLSLRLPTFEGRLKKIKASKPEDRTCA